MELSPVNRGPPTRNPCAQDSQADGLSPSSYFDALSEECVLSVLRHLSKRPRHERWACHIEDVDALSVLWSGGNLERVFRNEIASLGVFVYPFFELHSIHGNPFLLNFDGRNGERLRDAIFAKTKYGLSKVEFCNEIWLHVNPQMLQGVKHIRISCDDVFEPLRDVLSAYSGQVRTLDFDGSCLLQCDVDAIAENYSGLEILRLCFNSTTATDVTNLWKTVGPTLEHLILKFPGFGKGLLSADEEFAMSWANIICSSCDRVTKIEFLFGEYPLSVVAHVLERMGERLREVRLENSELNFEELSTMMSSCPNAVFDTWVACGDAGSLSESAKKIRALRIGGDPSEIAGLATVQFENLEEIYVYNAEDVTVEYLSAFFLLLPCLGCVKPIYTASSNMLKTLMFCWDSLAPWKCYIVYFLRILVTPFPLLRVETGYLEVLLFAILLILLNPMIL